MGNIDFVIPWVDGSDPLWQQEKNKYTPQNFGDDDRDIRYRDFGLLRYWFRGVEKFAPWVNKIYFITWGHLPEWLNTNHPKLEIVKHSDYIPEEYLPTFSSHVIELNMHRIKGLSENFIYFNDDVFILRDVKEEDFFLNGLPCDCLVESAITPRIGEFSSILCENVGVINRNFTKKSLHRSFKKLYNPCYKKLLIRTLTMQPYHYIMGFYNPHISQPYQKSTLEEVWEKEKEILHETCLHKFRGQNDVNQYLFRYWHLCKGEFVPQFPIGKMCNIRDQADDIYSAVQKQKYKVIAINDADDAGNIDEKQQKLINSFEMIFPDFSAFELDKG